MGVDKSRRMTAFGLAVGLLLTPMFHQKANSQAQVAIPVGAAVIVIGGIAYYVWLNSQGQEQRFPISGGGYLEDPEQEEQWGEYPASSRAKCRYLAGGKEWDWIDGKCLIKG